MTTPEFLGYQITKSVPFVDGRTVLGEYHLIGKRGGHYITWRRNTSERFQIINAKTRVFVTLHGNTFIDPANLDRLFVEVTA